MPSAWALIAIFVALLVSLTGALDARARLRTDRGRQRFKYALVAAAFTVAALQFFLQSRSARRLGQVESALSVRAFTSDQRSEIVASLASFSGQRYWVMTQGGDRHSEQARFAEQIDNILEAAGWAKSQSVMMRDSPVAPFRERPLPYIEHSTETGVVIFGPAGDPRDLNAAAALKDQLARLAIRVELGIDENLKSAVVVDVGPR